MSLIDDFVDMVSPYLEGIAEAFRAFMVKVKGIVKTLIAKIVDFANQVVGWFRDLGLIQGVHIPFISTRPEFKSMLHDAPVVDVGLFEGVYNDQTDEITELRYIAAEELDNQTRQVLGKEDLVVLT